MVTEIRTSCLGFKSALQFSCVQLCLHSVFCRNVLGSYKCVKCIFFFPIRVLNATLKTHYEKILHFCITEVKRLNRIP